MVRSRIIPICLFIILLLSAASNAATKKTFKPECGSTFADVAGNPNNPESNWRYIIAAAERGIDAADIVGFHGTSVEALEYLRDHGVLIAGEGGGPGTENSLYFAPINSQFPKMPKVPKYLGENKMAAFKHAISYAERISQEHNFVTQLGLELEDPKIRENAMVLVEHFQDESPFQEAWSFFQKQGISYEILAKALNGCRMRKGVVLALGKEIKMYEIKPGDGPEKSPGDYRVVVPEGLPLKTIVGIEPVGQIEWDFLNRFRGRKKKKAE